MEGHSSFAPSGRYFRLMLAAVASAAVFAGLAQPVQLSSVAGVAVLVTLFAVSQQVPATQHAAPARQHGAVGPQHPGPPVAQQSAFATFADTGRRTPSVQHSSHMSQHERQSGAHAEQGSVQQPCGSESVEQHPPVFATGESAGLQHDENGQLPPEWMK